MQSKLNLCGFHGLPLCLSGITRPPLSLAMEMADHDRRREAMKRQKSKTTAPRRADQEVAIQTIEERLLKAVRDGEIDGDLAALVHDLYKTNFTCAAKAA